jgi:hypothetical protein
MDKDTWYDGFLETIEEQFPKKSQLTDALMNLLSLEREAVYRRLRKEVMFTVFEVATIAREWNISLDTAISSIPEGGDPAFRLKLLKCVNPTKRDLKMMKNFVESFSTLKDDPKAEYIEVCNMLPRALFSAFPQLAKYYTFTWMYRYGGDKISTSFSQLDISPKMRAFEIAHFEALIQVANVHFIWDAQMIHYLINELKYYISIYLITPEEIALIKRDIHAFLDYMEDVTIVGHFPNKNNKVYLYISRTNIDTGYACYCSDKIKASKIRTFVMNVTVSNDVRLFNDLRKWLHLKKRAAVQISATDEKQRIEFFKKQRELVDTI